MHVICESSRYCPAALSHVCYPRTTNRVPTDRALNNRLTYYSDLYPTSSPYKSNPRPSCAHEETPFQKQLNSRAFLWARPLRNGHFTLDNIWLSALSTPPVKPRFRRFEPSVTISPDQPELATYVHIIWKPKAQTKNCSHFRIFA